MIENYADKKQKNKVVLTDKGDNIEVSLKKFDQDSGDPIQEVVTTTNSKHIADLIKDKNNLISSLKEQAKSLKDDVDNLTALQLDIVSLENSRVVPKLENEEGSINEPIVK